MSEQTHNGRREARTPSSDAEFFDDEVAFDPVAEADAARAARERMIARARLLWEQRGFLARATLWGLAAAVVLALVIPKRYESTARIMPPESQSGSAAALLAGMSGTGGLGAIAESLLGMQSTGALFVGILGSRTIQDRLIERFDLATVYGTTRPEDTREMLSTRTNLAVDRRSGIVTVVVEDRDPERAAAMATTYVTELDRLVVELTTSSAHRQRVFLEERLQMVKVDLDAAAKEFSQFASDNSTLDIREQGRAMVDAAAALQGQLIAAQTELEGMRQVYTDSNVRVRAVQARITELRKQLEQMGGVGAPAGAGGGADGPLYPTLRELPLLGVTYGDLYRRTKVQETVFELLTQQYELAKVQEAKEIPSVKVLDEPVVPEKKSFPPRSLIVLAGTLFAFCASTVWVFGRTRWDEVDAADPARQLVEEVFATLQAAPGRLTGAALQRRRLAAGNRYGSNGNGNGHHPVPTTGSQVRHAVVSPQPQAYGASYGDAAAGTPTPEEART